MTEETTIESRSRAEAGEAAGTEAGSGEAATRSAEGRVEIDASPERVWKALTEAAELERWFPLEARVEPGEGGSVFMSWKNEFAATSTILVWEPLRHLRTSWGWPEEGGEGGQAQVTDYYIEGRGGKTLLRVVTSGFPADAAWDDWVEGTRRGWRFELAALKQYLEEHPGEERGVVHVRRRVPLDREEAWARLFGPGGLDPHALAGQVVDDAPPVQYAVLLEEPPGALLRISTEPCAPDIEAKDVTFFLSAWGEQAGRAAALAEEWSRLLERLFPEGESP